MLCLRVFEQFFFYLIFLTIFLIFLVFDLAVERNYIFIVMLSIPIPAFFPHASNNAYLTYPIGATIPRES